MQGTWSANKDFYVLSLVLSGPTRRSDISESTQCADSSIVLIWLSPFKSTGYRREKTIR